MLEEFDLFGAPTSPLPAQRKRVAPLAALDPTALLPPRPIAWQRLLERLPPQPIELMVTTRWTGVVVETLSEPAARHHLTRDGAILEYPPDAVHTRIVFYTSEGLAELAERAPLVILLAGGTHGFLARFAVPGEPASADLAERLSALHREPANA
jgi:hypothetical protein